MKTLILQTLKITIWQQWKVLIMRRLRYQQLEDCHGGLFEGYSGGSERHVEDAGGHAGEAGGHAGEAGEAGESGKSGESGSHASYAGGSYVGGALGQVSATTEGINQS